MTTIRQSSSPLLLLGITVLLANSAEAVPIKNPENCSGPVTIGVATCPDKPGHWVECTRDGDYMCCAGNSQGGKDCEQIEDTAKTSKFGGMRAPKGDLKVSPGTTTTPTAPTTRMPKTGITTAPIMRRGVEGEQGAEPAPETGAGEGKTSEQQGK